MYGNYLEILRYIVAVMQIQLALRLELIQAQAGKEGPPARLANQGRVVYPVLAMFIKKKNKCSSILVFPLSLFYRFGNTARSNFYYLIFLNL